MMPTTTSTSTCTCRPAISETERILEYRERKRKEKNERNRKHHANMMSMANASEKEYKDTEEANRKREWREKVKARREKEKLRKRKYRTSLCTVDCPHTPLNPVHSNNFNNRTSKHRAIQRVRNALPETPEKRTATLAAYIDKSKSPTVKHLTELHLLTSPEERNELEIGTAVINDIKTAIDSTKRKRSKEALGSMNAIIGSVSGENIAKKKCQRRLADRLNLPVNRICAGKRIRTQILTSQSACWAYTCRKTRSDALPVETKRIAYNYWLSTGVSRPTGNKSDIKRERIAPNVYSKHMVHILEKTQTEVYLDFKRENPNIAIGQRSFEGCKPYYVRQVRQKDRQTCCCRYHVEIKSCFKACMDFRKKYVQDDLFPIFNDIGEISDVTLCATGDRYHDIACLKRMCTRCGIHKLQFHPDETDTSDKAENVKWEKFENVDVNMKGNKTVRKLLLVKKQTKPALLFAHFSELLKTFPLHQHRASWQSDQFKTLLSGLPQNHCIAVHDFSENYRCCEIRELQSGYFQKTEVSVHVTILHRHAVLALDGVDGTEESPIIVTEHFYIISPDLTHDQYFVHEARQQVSDYLKSISYPVQTMHEFTDGCAAQYKSRHCFGDISDSCKDYGYSTFTRNFFETSHSKGPQDAAGGMLKRQADIAVLRGYARIQNAKDLYTYATKNLTSTKSAGCKRRVFKYVESISRTKSISYKPVPNIRSVHHVRVENTDPPGYITLNELSCFSCDMCASEKYSECLNTRKISTARSVTMQKCSATQERDHVSTTQDVSQPMKELVSTDHIIAVVADDANLDYYLLFVQTSMYKLKKETRDHWGSSWPAGTEVFRGLYYDQIVGNPLQYRRIPKKFAIVPADSVIYICSELHAQPQLMLPEHVHLNILACVDEITTFI